MNIMKLFKQVSENSPKLMEISLLALGLVFFFLFIGWDALLIWIGSYTVTAIVFSSWTPWNVEGVAGLLFVCSLIASGVMIRRAILFYHEHFAFLKE